MEPKNGGLEDDFPFQTGDFQVPAVHFPGCNPPTQIQAICGVRPSLFQPPPKCFM